jgi:hypothetical protein
LRCRIKPCTAYFIPFGSTKNPEGRRKSVAPLRGYCWNSIGLPEVLGWGNSTTEKGVDVIIDYPDRRRVPFPVCGSFGFFSDPFFPFAKIYFTKSGKK